MSTSVNEAKKKRKAAEKWTEFDRTVLKYLLTEKNNGKYKKILDSNATNIK